MTTRVIVGFSVVAAAFALAACTPPHPHAHPKAALKSIDTLSCPDSQGDLTRKTVSADGKTCQYVDSRGDQITLALIALDGGDLTAALAPLETSLRAELPNAAESDKDSDGDDKAGAANKSAAGASDRDRVDIDLPGIHIHADGKDGDGKDQVRIGKTVSIQDGKTIVTESKSGGAGVTVDAHDKGAEIHVNEPGGGIRQTFILASDTPGPHGYKLASYQARGPEGGPIVVASVLSKSDEQDDLRHDLSELLKANVGG